MFLKPIKKIVHVRILLEVQRGVLRKLSRFISFLIWYHMRKLNEHFKPEAHQAGPNSYENQRFQLWAQQLWSFPTAGGQPLNPMSGQDQATDKQLRERAWSHIEASFAACVRAPAAFCKGPNDLGVWFLSD